MWTCLADYDSGRVRNYKPDHSDIIIEPNGAIGKFCSWRLGRLFPSAYWRNHRRSLQGSICEKHSVQQLTDLFVGFLVRPLLRPT